MCVNACDSEYSSLFKGYAIHVSISNYAGTRHCGSVYLCEVELDVDW